jgi:tetratricopeptide (TPR) repeat protein
LLRVISGKHPFFANDPSCLTSEEDNIKDKTFIADDLSSLRPDIPSRIASLVMGLLSRDPGPRERVAEQLKVALSESLDPIKETPKPSVTPIEALTAEESELINKSIEQARQLFFHYYDAPEAVQVLDKVLETVDWKRFEHKNITDIADCWSLRAYFLNARRGFQEAVDSASKGLLVEADHVNSFHVRAYAYTQLGDYTKAKANLEKALKLCRHYTKERQLKQLLATIEDRLKSPERVSK